MIQYNFIKTIKCNFYEITLECRDYNTIIDHRNMKHMHDRLMDVVEK